MILSNQSINQKAKAAVVIGASGGIGKAVLERLMHDTKVTRVFAISRNPSVTEQIDNRSPESGNQKVVWLRSDYSEKSISDISEELTEYKGRVSIVCICNGILHGDDFSPERRIEDIDSVNLQRIFNVNALIPIIWLKHLRSLLTGDDICRVAVLSARVGSIGDNRLGGWYAYRASKAALNMMLQNVAIEFARRAKNVQIVAFHPGTTDTGLSKPFQKNVPKGKLFKSEFVAERLLNILFQYQTVGPFAYLDWDNKTIPF
ncbi:MAG: NAD(P)-dependent dehydrogenase (short-subunit alcohol dehydrogenase family) [Polaribacter sp.]|jgi:NAD(P)-dependent dehydrogenase (short-subunit alcohol dehydrogenase family)